MGISFFSFFAALVWSSVIILLFCAVCRSELLKKKIGITGLVIIFWLCMLRLVCPIEFPGLVRIIGVQGVVADIYEWVALDKVCFLGISVKRIYLISLLWGISIFIALSRWYISYKKAMKMIKNTKRNLASMREAALEKVKERYQKKVAIVVWETPLIDVPMGVGLFHKTILLPQKIDQEKDLYYILLHEYTHFVNGDLWFKFFVHIVCCVFWWNPFVCLLKREIDHLLEIRCDLTLSEIMNNQERAEYLEVIVKVLKQMDEKQCGNEKINTVELVQRGKQNLILERFKIVKDQEQGTRKLDKFCYGCIGLFFIFLMGSYIFQIQAEYSSPEISGEERLILDDDYLVDNGDGTYTWVDTSGRAEDCKLSGEQKWIVEDLIRQGITVKRREN